MHVLAHAFRERQERACPRKARHRRHGRRQAQGRALGRLRPAPEQGGTQAAQARHDARGSQGHRARAAPASRRTFSGASRSRRTSPRDLRAGSGRAPDTITGRLPVWSEASAGKRRRRRVSVEVPASISASPASTAQGRHRRNHVSKDRPHRRICHDARCRWRHVRRCRARVGIIRRAARRAIHERGGLRRADTQEAERTGRPCRKARRSTAAQRLNSKSPKRQPPNVTGKVTGSVFVPPFDSTLSLLGIPTTVGVTFTPGRAVRRHDRLGSGSRMRGIERVSGSKGCVTLSVPDDARTSASPRWAFWAPTLRPIAKQSNRSRSR